MNIYLKLDFDKNKRENIKHLIYNGILNDFQFSKEKDGEILDLDATTDYVFNIIRHDMTVNLYINLDNNKFKIVFNRYKLSFYPIGKPTNTEFYIKAMLMLSENFRILEMNITP